MSLPISWYKERYALQEKERTLKEENQLIDMLEFERAYQEEKDECWRRMMASRTPLEIEQGICAPG